MCKNTPDKIVDIFIDTTIKKCTSATINTKNILFIWKKFLEERNVPNIILHGPLKKILREKIAYNNETDMFIDVTSVHLPVVSQFIHFWDTYISEDENEMEIEIDELMRLFRKTTRLPVASATTSASASASVSESKISDSLLIELIKHFYPDTEILEDKYIMNIRCSLWDKRGAVKKSLEMFRIKERNTVSNTNTPLSNFVLDVSPNISVSSSSSSAPHIHSLYDAYEFYCNTNVVGTNVVGTNVVGTNVSNAQSQTQEYIVSKRYFEKMTRELIGVYVDDDGVISNEWMNSFV